MFGRRCSAFAKRHSNWHLEHKRPCADWDLTKPAEQAGCFHYSNYQPLWAKDNLSKGAKLNWLPSAEPYYPNYSDQPAPDKESSQSYGSQTHEADMC